MSSTKALLECSSGFIWKWRAWSIKAAARPTGPTEQDGDELLWLQASSDNKKGDAALHLCILQLCKQADKLHIFTDS